MGPYLQHTILDNQFVLSPQKLIFWEQQKSIIISDLHLGKTGHFRKNGIGIPQPVFKEDLQNLFAAVQYFKPECLIVVGDLFHSSNNSEHNLFVKWRQNFPRLSIQLVLGNHDVMPAQWYSNAGLTTFSGCLQMGAFAFTHDIAEVQINNQYYYFSGHIHPAVTMKGLAKQSISLPCFYFGKQYAILPAFGKFTGTHTLKVKKGEKAFAILQNRVIEL